MYRRVSTAPAGMSGLFDSIVNAIRGIRITAPPINIPQISLPTSIQIPGTRPTDSTPSSQAMVGVPPNATPDWLLPVGLAAVGVVAAVMLSRRRR